MSSTAQTDTFKRILVVGGLFTQLCACAPTKDEPHVEPDAGGGADSGVVSDGGPEADASADAQVEGELEATVTFAESLVSVRFEHAMGLYVEQCANGVRILRPGSSGTWEPLHDARPWDTNGPFYLDGVYHEQVQPGVACGVRECIPLEDQTLLREEYWLVEGDPHPDEIDLETKIYRGPLRIQVEAYEEETCAGGHPTLVRSFDVEAP